LTRQRQRPFASAFAKLASLALAAPGFQPIKLQAQVEIFLVNAAECEPMLKVDQQLMAQQAARLVRGVLYGMTATGATEGIIALKEKYRAAIAALTPLLPAQIRLHILPDVYPAGDEVITIWMATGRRVPPAALPVSVGVVVNNVQTVLNIARAVEQQYPVTRRTLTVNGAVRHPLTVTSRWVCRYAKCWKWRVAPR
jgi:Na+-translocating ferredoxin:NAD+ oxidoreductase RnfC subunit